MYSRSPTTEQVGLDLYSGGSVRISAKIQDIVTKSFAIFLSSSMQMPG
jgi:hypothetical protein